ncbi:MAG: MBL fold metallo-hydrolase [Gammaproteobacteria bacterium]|nr:MBL fold metallo-hydrolase [Gammaproteobacteria bacterium]
MNRVMPDLWETEVESPHPGLTTHAYLLVRGEGNVLFYNTGHRHEIERMAELGGVARQFLSHRDELGGTINDIREHYGAKLGGHVNEKDDFARIRVPDILFERRETLLGNVEVIPTPGHTPGSTCFLVHAEIGRKYLFTGDTLYLAADGTFRPGLLSFSNREDLVASLELLATLEPDVALSSAFGGDSGFKEVSGQWAEHVAAALEKLKE